VLPEQHTPHLLRCRDNQLVCLFSCLHSMPHTTPSPVLQGRHPLVRGVRCWTGVRVVAMQRWGRGCLDLHEQGEVRKGWGKLHGNSYHP
jgi:hypothetical protein